MQNKENLRRICKETLDNLLKTGRQSVISDKICNKISSSSPFLNSENVMLFYPLSTEINLLKLLDFDKKFFFPKCKDGNILVCPYKKDCFIKGAYGIYEPSTPDIKDLSVLELIIVPALCAGKNGYRLGRGMGYYDRFLKHTQLKAKTVVVVPKKLCFDEIPHDDFDVKCDYVITD